MKTRTLTLGGVVFEAITMNGWPGRRLVYHLRQPDGPFRYATLCSRQGWHPRDADDDPRDLCERCAGGLRNIIGNAGGETGGLRDELDVYEATFVRPAPASVDLSFGRIQEVCDGRGDRWFFFGRDLARPETLPNYIVPPAEGATLRAEGDESEYRASVRWRVDEEGNPTRVWADLYVLGEDGRGESGWYKSTPRHEPVEAALVEAVRDLWRPQERDL